MPLTEAAVNTLIVPSTVATGTTTVWNSIDNNHNTKGKWSFARFTAVTLLIKRGLSPNTLFVAKQSPVLSVVSLLYTISPNNFTHNWEGVDASATVVRE